MYESPTTLEELCLDTIVDNLECYIEPVFSNDAENRIKKYVFESPDLFLFAQLSEKLLSKLMSRKILCDETMNLFSKEHTNLRNVRIGNCTHITHAGLEILKEHKITRLECVNLKGISVGNIIDCLNEWSLEHIFAASFSRCSFINTVRHTYMVKVLNLRNIRSLILSYTELNQHCFSMICEDLVHLETLDISGTHVKNLTPLLRLTDRLKGLGLADLPDVSCFVTVVTQMNKVEHIDLSLVVKKAEMLDIEVGKSPVTEILDNNTCLPNLRTLEVSGWKHFLGLSTLSAFVEEHSNLEYLGIVLSDVLVETLICDSSYFSTQLVIAGLGSEDQIKVTLHRYKDKSTYVQKALFHLFQHTNCYLEPKPDLYKVVLPVMAAHPYKFGVQMAATACLYNLTKGELSKPIHPHLLTVGINLTLNAMSNFPKEFQLQKNALLTLCNDRILQEVGFDKCRCAELVLNTLCAFTDTNTSRMAVAICSILAAKISTKETSRLGAKPRYMKKLLEMVRTRIDSQLSDITLKFTLSALWNLTDESPATCTVFLHHEGAFLFLKVLQNFKHEGAIETKVLGLLNNIAEVSNLRHNLMFNLLVNELSELLYSDNIDVSYFAAGIVAHLASDGPQTWTVTDITRDQILTKLEENILRWKVPDTEMVAYRSFRPFFSLLGRNIDYRVQLWAVWAIHHVCTKNPKRYCKMLKEEKGHVLLQDLINDLLVHAEINRIAKLILLTLQSNQ